MLKMRSIWMGVLIAPWITTFALLLASYGYLLATQGAAGLGGVESGLSAGFIYLAMTYAIVLIFGLPTIWLLGRLRRLDPFHLSLMSAVEGAMVLNAFGWTTGRHLSQVLWTAIMGAILGAITGGVAVVVARPGRSASA